MNAAKLYPSLSVPIPLLIGGNNRRVLELAAQRANIVSFTGFFPRDGGRSSDLAHFTARGLADRLAIVRSAAGGRLADIELNVLVQAVVPAASAAVAAQRASQQLTTLSRDDAATSPFLLLGTEAEMVDALLDRRERFGVSYFAVFEPAMEALAPVIARLRERAA